VYRLTIVEGHLHGLVHFRSSFTAAVFAEHEVTLWKGSGLMQLYTKNQMDVKRVKSASVASKQNVQIQLHITVTDTDVPSNIIESSSNRTFTSTSQEPSTCSMQLPCAPPLMSPLPPIDCVHLSCVSPPSSRPVLFPSFQSDLYSTPSTHVFQRLFQMFDIHKKGKLDFEGQIKRKQIHINDGGRSLDTEFLVFVCFVLLLFFLLDFLSGVALFQKSNRAERLQGNKIKIYLKSMKMLIYIFAVCL
jgi:hypothetical protein